MNKTVFIIGLDHKYQHNSELYQNVEDRALLALESDICKVVEEKQISAIGEEFCLEDLMKGSKESYIKVIADKIDKPHIYCNPTSAEYEEFGIKQSILKMKNETEEDFRKRDWENDMLREKGWLNKIIEFNKWPLLFICGPLHTYSFIKLLSENKIDAKILCQSWDY